MKFQKYLSLFFLVLCIAFASFAKADGSASVSFNGSPATARVGDMFTTTISIDPGTEKIDTARIKFTYPADLLEIKSFAPGALFSYQSGGNAYDNSAGTFSWGAGLPGGTTTKSDFGTVTFIVKKQGAATITLSADTLLLSAGVNEFNGQLSSASYTLLGQAPATAAPAVTTSKPVVAKIPSAAVNPSPNVTAVAQPQTQVIPQNHAQGFINSLLAALPIQLDFIQWLSVGAALLAVVLAFTIYKLAKPLLE